MHDLLKLPFEVPTEFKPNTLSTIPANIVRFDPGASEKFGLMSFFVKIKRGALGANKFCDPELAQFNGAVYDRTINRLPDEYKQSLRDIAAMIGMYNYKHIYDWESGQMECWIEFLLNDRYAKQFVWNHKSLFKLQGTNAEDVFKYALDSNNKFSFNWIETVATGDLKEFVAGPNGILPILTSISVISERVTAAVAELNAICSRNDEVACLSDYLVKNVIGEVNIWPMRMRKLDQADLVVKLETKFVADIQKLHPTIKYRTTGITPVYFEGDDARESYFPFGIGLNNAFYSILDLGKSLASSTWQTEFELKRQTCGARMDKLNAESIISMLTYKSQDLTGHLDYTRTVLPEQDPVAVIEFRNGDPFPQRTDANWLTKVKSMVKQVNAGTS